MKLGVLQTAFGGFEAQRRLEALAGALRGTTLDLLVCPELVASGYHIDGTHAGLAEPADGPFAGQVAEIAGRSGTAILYGYPEAADGAVYNSAALIGMDGALIATHRKRLMSPGSFEETSFACGDGPTFADFAGLRIAIVICYEIEFPETARQAARGGADLLLAPTALVDRWRVVAERVIPARAFENGIFVAYANHAGRELDFNYFGGSRIVAPDGTELAVAGAHQELIAADIDPARVSAAREKLPYLRDYVKL